MFEEETLSDQEEREKVKSPYEILRKIRLSPAPKGIWRSICQEEYQFLKADRYRGIRPKRPERRFSDYPTKPKQEKQGMRGKKGALLPTNWLRKAIDCIQDV